MRDGIAPLYNRYNVLVACHLGQLFADNAHIGQAVKIKVVDLEVRAVVNLADGKGGAGDFVVATGATGQATHQGRLAAPQVAYQFNYLPAF